MWLAVRLVLLDSLDVQNLSALGTDLGRTAQGVGTQVVGWLCARCFVHYCITASVGVGEGADSTIQRSKIKCWSMSEIKKISELRYSILFTLFESISSHKSRKLAQKQLYSLFTVLYMLGDLFSKWTDCPTVPPHVRTISLPFPCCPYRPAFLSSLFLQVNSLCRGTCCQPLCC